MRNQLFLVVAIFIVASFEDGVNTDQQNCGTALTTRRIVGGYDVGYYKYPWFASLELDGDANCGGTLIGLSTVVSAAHCFKDFIKSKKPLEEVFKVKLGLYNNCAQNEVYQEVYNVKKVYIHEKYWKFRKIPYFDIAILILDGDTRSYLPACMPTKVLASSTRGAEAFIQGLGDLKDKSNNYPCALREARVLIYTHKECQRMLKRYDEKHNIKHAFCAGYLEGGIDACQGDSGGPLVTLNNRNKYTLLGITSTGYGCAKKGALGLYTDVSHYLKWIKSKTGLIFADNDNEGPNSNDTVLIPVSFVNGTEIIITIEVERKRIKKKIKRNKRKYRGKYRYLHRLYKKPI